MGCHSYKLKIFSTMFVLLQIRFSTIPMGLQPPFGRPIG